MEGGVGSKKLIGGIKEYLGWYCQCFSVTEAKDFMRQSGGS
jgi:hypothetical protein